eukprot:CAMPEP_0119015296 /NCGR_PEP_ID=MMETSP1176-20130426/10755_1 /TAXON_ID=265551 /ORGANISM="Synedropsis recta cf, Strain CCMP1620" /LENGTH=684 /DNA_ID=CAMNT_0006968575 /DNA_START=51 /DNA_END=2108 /DNA_ORIENTATION=+
MTMTATAMRHRKGGHGDTTLPLVRKESKHGDVKPYKPKSRRTRMKQMASLFVKYLSYAIILLVIVLVLVLRFDTKDLVRHKVVNLKNRVLGNTADYGSQPMVITLFDGSIQEEPAVNGEHVVFCTVSNLQQDETFVGRGTSPKSPFEALKMAQTKLPRTTNKYPYVKIDIVTGVKRYEDFNYFDEFEHLPSRWFGLALNWNTDWVFTAEEVHTNALVDKNQFIRWERLALYAAKSGRTEGAMALPDFGDDGTTVDYVDAFHADSILLDFSKNDFYPLYHGHRLYPELTPQLLKDRSKDAGAHLAQIVKDTGRQVYKYNPRSDYEPFGYNLTRHAGTLYAMARIFRWWQDSYLKQSMKLTLGYLKQSIQDCPLPLHPEKTAKCSVDFESKDKLKMAKLGVNALTILAIVEYVDAVRPDDATELLQLASSIADFVQGSMRDDGSFVQKIHLSTENTLLDVDDDFFVRYYQGEVTFALARMTHLAQQNKWSALLPKTAGWMTTAEQAALSIIKTDALEEDDAAFTFDHWLLYGIAEMDATEGFDVPDSFVDHAVRTTEVASKWQNGNVDAKEEPDDIDRLGIYYDDLSSTATATKSEGLCVVIDLLEKKKKNWKLAFDTAVLSVRYQLQAQYQPEEAMFMRNPQRILGGFHDSILSSELRNDYTQHNLCSLLCLSHVMEKRGIKSAK